MNRHMHPKTPKGLSLGLSFQFFEYLGFEFEFEYFSNFEKDNLKKKIKDLFFEYGFEYQF